MINTIDELKELIEWAKKTKVKSLKVGEIHVELSDYAFIEHLVEGVDQAPQKDAATTATPDWSSGDLAEDKAEDEAVLYHSSRQ